MRRTSRVIRPPEWVAGIVVSLLAAVLLVEGPEIKPILPAGALAFVLAGLGLFLCVRSLTICRLSLRQGGGYSHLGSAIFGIGVILAVVIPGAQLLAGTRESRIESLGFPTPDPAPDLAVAFLLYIMALLGFYFGETLVSGGEVLRRREFATSVRRAIGRTWESRITYWVLMAVGVPLVLFAGTAFEDRGRTVGKGVQQMFGYAPPIAIAIAILNLHWRSKRYAAVSIVVVFVLINGGIRTPLMIVAAAAGMRYLRSTSQRKFGLQQLAMGALAIYVGATLLVALSTFRGTRADGGQASLVTSLTDAAADPFAQLQTQGVDTVDGLILALKVDPDYVGASWTDPSKILTGFIPHQLWANKPKFLAATVSQTYTNFPAGAIFLSGPGYAVIVFRTIVAVPLMFMVLGAFSETLFWRMREPSLWSALLAYFLVRAFFEGDAFSAFHVIGLCIVFALARFATGLINLLHRPPEVGRGGVPGTAVSGAAS